MSGTINQKLLAKKIKGFKDEAAFLKFIRLQSDEKKDEICRLFPDNKFVIKYINDRGKAAEASSGYEAGETRSSQVLRNKEYEDAEKEIEALLEKSPLNTPFLTGVQGGRYYEPKISYFNARPKLDKDVENDAKFLFRIINTHLTSKSPVFTKEEIERKLVSASKQRASKKCQVETDLRTVLALHDWSLARSRAMPKNRKNDLFIAALKNLCRAMYMGGFSYFNVSSFGLIYTEYVKNYELIINEKKKEIMGNSQLYDFLPVVRSHSDGIELFKKSSKFLNSRLISLFETHSLDFKLKKLYTSDFEKALSNYFSDKPDKMINGIHSKVYIFLYLDLLVYLACIHQMELPKMLAQYNSLNTIVEKNYDILLRVHAIQTRQLLYQLYLALSQAESEPDGNTGTTNTATESKAGPSPYDLLCRIMTSCNQTINEIRKKSNVDRYIEVKFYELHPLYRYYDALVNYLPHFEVDKDMKVFTINFLRNGLFFKQQAIARHKDDRIVNAIQKMMDVLKALYKTKVKEFEASMIKSGEPEYAVTSDSDGQE
ncbi:MAG: hypothetical protein GY866_17250 [Proteobacteria bacterium]|nr:hypothetical protein [Pseudomonadota bacterium]